MRPLPRFSHLAADTVRRKSLVDEVVLRLRELIERSGLVAGDRLPSEAELMTRLAVSRSVLREAVSQLGTLGLIRVKRGHGMFVGDMDSVNGCLKLVRSAMAVSPRDLTQFAELRSAIECYVARRAAERATPEKIGELQGLCDEMDREDHTYEEAITIDFAFHRKICEIAGTELIVNTMSVLQQFVLEGMLQTTPNPRDREVSQRLHRAIAEAIRGHDPEAAEGAMREHMRITSERLTKAAETQRENPKRQ